MKVELDISVKNWSKYAKTYDPIRCASIDGTDCEPHDRAVVRALNSTYKPNRFVKGQPECTIFVSRLNHETSKDTIKDIFSKYGKLKRFRMVKDIVTGMPKGYAFVEYEEEQGAEDAYRLANRMVVDGNVIFVDFECERLLKGWKPRRLGGGFAGKKESGQLRFGGRDRPFKKPIALELKEQEEKQQTEKERRTREDRRCRDKSRDRHKRKSPARENGISSPSRTRKKQDFFSTERPKARVSAEDKPKSDLPSRKLSRHYSPPKDSKNLPSLTYQERNVIQKDDKAIRDKISDLPLDKNAPPRQTSKSFSPQEKIVKRKWPLEPDTAKRSPSSKNAKQKLSERNNKNKSPLREGTNQKSPSRENPKPKYPLKRDTYQISSLGKRSPTRQKTKLPSKDNFPLGKLKRPRSPPVRENVRHQSPTRQSGRPHSPFERHLKHSPPRVRARRSSPLERKLKYSSERDIDIKSPLRRRDKRSLSRSRSPLYRNGKYDPLSKEDVRRSQHDRRKSPVRKQGSYFSEKRNDRSHSPLQHPEHDQQFLPGYDRVQHVSPRSKSRNSPIYRNYLSPHRNDTREHRSYQFPPREQYSPGKRSPPRNINQRYSPSKHNVRRRLSSGNDSMGYQHQGTGNGEDSPIHKLQTRSSLKEYSQPIRGNQVHLPYEYENPYNDCPSYSGNPQRERDVPPTHANFRQYSPTRVDFRQPPPLHESPREYTSFPPPSRDFPSQDVVGHRSFSPKTAHSSRVIQPARNLYPPRDNEHPGFISPPRQNERDQYPFTRQEGGHYESSHQKPLQNFPPMRESRKFPHSREIAGHSNAGRGRFPRQRGGARGGRGGFRQYQYKDK